jgi:hypothetical protein
MGDAIRIEQRLHELVDNWRRRQRPKRSVPGESAREMERQAVERLFANQRVRHGPAHAADLKSAREMARQAVERLYGGRSNVVVRDEHDAGGEGA